HTRFSRDWSSDVCSSDLAGDMLVFAVTADGWSDEQLSWYIDDAIAKRLFGVPGVGAVRRIGGVDREIRVDLRPEAVQGFGVSPRSEERRVGKGTSARGLG